MNFKQLEVFDAISNFGATTAAAQHLDLSQPAVSRLLSQLEEDLGLKLFVREHGRLTPTREGETLVTEVHTIIEATRCLRRHAQQLRLGGSRRKLIRVMVPNTLAEHLLPAVVQRFCSEQTDAALEILSGTYEQAEHALLSREVDLAFVMMPTKLPGVVIHHAFVAPSVCVLPANHALAALDTIDVSDLEDVPMILIGRHSSHRHEIDTTFRRAHIKPNVIAEVHSVGVACGIVACGMGVAIVNRLLVETCRAATFEMRPFTPALTLNVGIASLEAMPPVALQMAFTSCLAEALRNA